MGNTRAAALLAVAATACGSNQSGPQPIADDPAVITGCTGEPPGPGQTRAKRVECDAELVRGAGPDLLAAGKVGDIVLDNARIRVIVRVGSGFTFPGSPPGTIVDAARHGHTDQLKELLPIAELNIGDHQEIAIVEAGDDGPAEVVVRGPAVPVGLLEAAVGTQPVAAIVETHYVLMPDVPELMVRTFLFPRAAETGDGPSLQMGEIVFTGGGTEPWLPGKGRPEGIQGAEFVASTGPDASYGVVYPADVPGIQFLNIENITGALGPLHRLGDGGSVDRWLVVGDGSAASISDRAWQLREQPLGEVVGTSAPGADVEIAGDQGPVTVARTGADGTFRAQLPPGNYVAQVVSDQRAEADGAAFSVAADAQATVEVVAGAQGILEVAVTSPGADPLPARVVVRSETGTRRIHYTGAAGAATLPLPPGSYTVDVSRGVEYDAFTADPVVVSAGETTAVAATLDRVIDTSGWISIDTHLHSEMSTDSTISLVDRLSAVAAEGVEIALSTDHDFVTDYGPAVRALGLGDWLAYQAGVETSTLTHGHFQLWPMEPDPTLAAGGALPWYGRAPSELFADMRAIGPHVFIQVNHPRSSGSGYFDAVDFDRDLVRAMRNPAELGFSDTDLNDFNFDAIEVANDFNDDEFEASFDDWLALVASGHPAAATGSSDSHGAGAFAGNSRTYVYVGVGQDDPTRIDLAAVDAALKQRRAVVSQGAFVTAGIRDPDSGDPAAPGAMTNLPTGGEATLHVVVQAPPWMPLSRIRVYSGRLEVASVDLDSADTGAVRFDGDIAVPLEDGDGFFVVRVDPAGPGAPVLGNPVASFTNPLIYDRDGDGQWTP